MKQYRTPVLADLGEMSHVTRKSGVYNDAPGEIDVTRAVDQGPQWFQIFCNVLPFLPVCQPIGP